MIEILIEILIDILIEILIEILVVDLTLRLRFDTNACSFQCLVKRRFASEAGVISNYYMEDSSESLIFCHFAKSLSDNKYVLAPKLGVTRVRQQIRPSDVDGCVEKNVGHDFGGVQ